MKNLLVAMIGVLALTSALVVQAEIKRTASGKPDLSGVYDTGTLTPLERPEFLGETEYLYPWFADLLNWAAGIAIGARWLAFRARLVRNRDAGELPTQDGGAGPSSAATNHW